MLAASIISSFSFLVASSTVAAAPLGAQNTGTSSSKQYHRAPESRVQLTHVFNFRAKRIDVVAQLGDFGAAIRKPLNDVMRTAGTLFTTEAKEVLDNGARAPLQSIGSVWKNQDMLLESDDTLVNLKALRNTALRATSADHTDADIRILKGLAYYGGDTEAKAVLEGMSPAVRAKNLVMTQGERTALGVGLVGVGAATGAGVGISVPLAVHAKHKEDSEGDAESDATTPDTTTPVAAKRSLIDLD